MKPRPYVNTSCHGEVQGLIWSIEETGCDWHGACEGIARLIKLIINWCSYCVSIVHDTVCVDYIIMIDHVHS